MRFSPPAVACIVLVATVLFDTAAISIDERPSGDQQSIQGSWKVVSKQENGEVVDKAKLPNDYRFVFSGDSLVTKKGEEILIKGKFELDTVKSPKQISITATSSGIAIQVTIRGIYKLEGERLTIGLARRTPESFATKKGDGTRIMILERMQAKRK